MTNQRLERGDHRDGGKLVAKIGLYDKRLIVSSVVN